ncbi:TMEM165/GDT1 family protein [Haladaptatus sp. DYF46]|uniref:TMEM165/GDT1 family protein n=1 Tax=Haladaptatus sp. DYF46 TaxID=2886041 RepID=UPI001E475005|nr:TMEM165/GDT1 family protein [Haladaptatus sp. DYF46]
MVGTATPLATGLQHVIHRYEGYGPVAAAFLANLLATFGDKGQLVVVTLASRYDAKRVFVGAMAAFTLWSTVEIAFGHVIVSVLPGTVITVLTGGLFVVFGLWTLRSAVSKFTEESDDRPLLTAGGMDVGVTGTVIPDGLLTRMGAYGGVLTTFVFILFAEFGDKTQLLTINLATTFPNSPLSIFVGVIAALGLRTGLDAVIGERFERILPTKWLELVAAFVFLAFGALVFAEWQGFL